MRNAERQTETVLSVLRERGRRGLPCDELYRQLFNPQLYLLAYGRIYSNKGAMTPGPDAETADGMTLGKIERIIDALRHERYRFKPVRRLYIPKKDGKQRPLGLPSWSDKLLGEVVRLLLEAYYEPQFSDHSHGYRPGRGCHTALRDVAVAWTGTTWFIEGDISRCFDQLDHSVMLATLEEMIHDNRLLRLIGQMLRAGYLEDWVWNATLSGAPQGGVLSPCLSNIYLYRLATVERLAEGTRLMDEGVDPGRDRELWKLRANQLVAVAERGVLPITRASTVQELGSWVTGLGVRRLYAYLYLSSRDLVPFLTLFILKSGMELPSAVELRSDCLSSAGGGYVMVSYTKRRSGRVSPPPLRVKDGGRTTAGGLLRLVLGLTELSRQHSDDDLIFTAINTGGRQFFAGLTEPQLRRESRAFTARHGIHDDDSKPLGAISFRRLRKTQKALRYIAARGQLDVMATGHSIEVAGTHYANVRALDDFHEQAVERALNQALGADTSGGATVMDEDTEAALAAGDRRVAEQLRLSDEAAEQAARGGTDLWLAGCRDFFDAPHGSPNTPCATPYFGCVGCANALVGPSKLPAIHAFIRHAERQAEVLAEPVWEAIYGLAYAGAVDIIGRFSRAENEAARLIAERLTVALPLEVAA